MALPRRRAPFWFLLAVTIAGALALRALAGAGAGAGPLPGSPAPPSAAFFFFLILIGELIWKGVEVAGRVTLQILQWIVAKLSLVVTKLKNGLGVLGAELLKALKRAWDFTRRVYDEVLKPAWDHFWNWFDKFRRWLDDTIGPVLDWLRTLRENLLTFWKLYVRPWLDLIDVTRKLLRVLAALHIPFARELDRRLGQLEQQIEKPFRILLAELNKVIGIVNRIVTLDGLLQRLVLIRSLARDYQYAWDTITKPYSKPITPEVHLAMVERMAAAMIAAGVPPSIAIAAVLAGQVYKPPEVVEAETRAYLRKQTGPEAALMSEMAIVWRKALGVRK